MNKKAEEYKMILVGDKFVGKTSIVKRHTVNMFSDSYKVTIGLQCTMKNQRTKDGALVSLDLWDTAGDERYRSVFPQYYRGTHIALLVFDITEAQSFEHIKYWQSELMKIADQSLKLVLLVGNKSDLAADRAVTSRDAASFALDNNMIYYETSAKTGENIKNLFNDAIDSIHEITIATQRENSGGGIILPADPNSPEGKGKRMCCNR